MLLKTLLQLQTSFLQNVKQIQNQELNFRRQQIQQLNANQTISLQSRKKSQNILEKPILQQPVLLSISQLHKYTSSDVVVQNEQQLLEQRNQDNLQLTLQVIRQIEKSVSQHSQILVEPKSPFLQELTNNEEINEIEQYEQQSYIDIEFNQQEMQITQEFQNIEIVLDVTKKTNKQKKLHTKQQKFKLALDEKVKIKIIQQHKVGLIKIRQMRFTSTIQQQISMKELVTFDSNELEPRKLQIGQMLESCISKVSTNTTQLQMDDINLSYDFGMQDQDQQLFTENLIGQSSYKLKYTGSQDQIQYFMHILDVYKHGQIRIEQYQNYLKINKE